MTSNALGAVVLGAALAASCPASARAPAPLIPTALVEDVKSASADVEFMDYVGTGQVIKLEPGDVLVLSYLRSCEHETITGGTVRVGPSMSEVAGGKITRSKVPCNGGNMKVSSAQANASGASSFRVQDAPLELTVYALPPVFEIPKLRAGDARTWSSNGRTAQGSASRSRSTSLWPMAASTTSAGKACSSSPVRAMPRHSETASSTSGWTAKRPARAATRPGTRPVAQAKRPL